MNKGKCWFAPFLLFATINRWRDVLLIGATRRGVAQQQLKLYCKIVIVLRESQSRQVFQFKSWSCFHYQDTQFKFTWLVSCFAIHKSQCIITSSFPALHSLASPGSIDELLHHQNCWKSVLIRDKIMMNHNFMVALTNSVPSVHNLFSR